jgi:hypothetical protein
MMWLVPEESQIDEIQVRALAVANPSSTSSHLSELSAEILPFSLRPRSSMSSVSESSVQFLPSQPYAHGHAPLSVGLAFDTQQDLVYLARSWLFDALVEVDRLSHLASESGFLVPPEKSIERTRSVARACSSLGLSEPTFDARENGVIEIFCREGARGLLILIHPNDLFQVFGDFEGDQWRARYSLKGLTWNTHLKKFLQDLALR